MQNQYVNNFDATDAHFDYSSLFSDAQIFINTFYLIIVYVLFWLKKKKDQAQDMQRFCCTRYFLQKQFNVLSFIFVI
jgi:hypothetical protein